MRKREDKLFRPVTIDTYISMKKLSGYQRKEGGGGEGQNGSICWGRAEKLFPVYIFILFSILHPGK